MYYLGVRDGEVCICAPDIPLSAAHFGSVAESDLYLGACTGMPFFTSSYVRASATMVDFCNPLLRLMREKCMSFYPLEMQSGLSCLMVTESGLRGRDGRGGEFELEGMRLPSVRCCTFAGGSLHMALKRGGQSWLWSDGELKEVGCNGYISCLTAGQ